MENKIGYYSIKNFILIKLLRNSKSVNEYLSISEENDKKHLLFFVKKIPIKETNLLEQMIKESKILSQRYLEHPNIIKCINNSLRSINNHYLVYEYCELGNIYEFVKSYKDKFTSFPTINIIQKIMRGITNAISKMHKENVIPGELNLKYIHLKYNNIHSLIEKYGKDYLFEDNIQLIKRISPDELVCFFKELLFKFKDDLTIQDFEDFFENNVEIKVIYISSENNLNNYEENQNINQSFIKTDFISEEMKLNKKYDSSIDMCSIGAIALYLLTGQFRENEIFEQVVIDEKLKTSIEIIDFIRFLLRKDPKLKLNYNAIINHPFLSRDANTFKYKDFQEYNSFCFDEYLDSIIDEKEKQEEEVKKENHFSLEIKNYDTFSFKENYLDELYSLQIVTNIYFIQENEKEYLLNNDK